MNRTLRSPADLAAAGLIDAERLPALERVAAQYIGKPNGGNRADETNEKLQTALSSRVVIGQATGILAERGNIDMASALALLKSSARSTGERLADVAGNIVAGAAIVIIDARSLAAGSKDPWDVPTGADPPPGG
jgi:hypothetical protein